MKEQVFTTPLPQMLTHAVKVARKAQAGDFDDLLASSLQQQTEKALETTGMTLEQLDALGAPQTWIGRQVERVQDWWWERSAAPAQGDDILAANFYSPIGILQTLPLDDIPMEYDDFYQLLDEATTSIITAISEQTEWDYISFEKAGPEDGEDYGPLDLVKAAWTRESSENWFVLVEDLAEDPGLFGHSLGLTLLTNDAADYFAQQVAKFS